MKKLKYFNLALCLILTGSMLQAQTIKVEREGLYGSKINNPISIEVSKIGYKYVFYGFNDSYYPYIIHLKVTDIVNLTPTNVDKIIKLGPGRSPLVELKMQDGSRSPSYRYDFTYSIGIPSNKVDPDYPYLIPLKTPFEILYSSDENKQIVKNDFKASKGDTVYAMRKGKVAATPDMFSSKERISNKESLEIIHKDNTIMVYENIDPDAVFVVAGKQVNPGQPIGLLKETAVLEVLLYKSLGDGYLEQMDINYAVDEIKTVAFSEELKSIPVSYPESLVTKEFSKREMKSYEKGELLEQ